MSEINPTTEGGAPVGTEGVTPPATQPQGQPTATDDETITLSMKDYKALQAQRDRANNDNKELFESVSTLEARQAEADKKEFLSDFLETNKKDYPDLTIDDLMGATSKDEVEELAKKQQRRYEDVVQGKLLERTRATTPVLSPEERSAKLKALKENPDKSSFGQFLNLQQSK